MRVQGDPWVPAHAAGLLMHRRMPDSNAADAAYPGCRGRIHLKFMQRELESLDANDLLYAVTRRATPTPRRPREHQGPLVGP